MKIIRYETICEKNKCPEFIRWDTGFGECTSCKLIGQSEIISEYPKDCLFKNEIIKHEKSEKMETYFWNTEEALSTNELTMQDYLENHLTEHLGSAWELCNKNKTMKKTKEIKEDEFVKYILGVITAKTKTNINDIKSQKRTSSFNSFRCYDARNGWYRNLYSIKTNRIIKKHYYCIFNSKR